MKRRPLCLWGAAATLGGPVIAYAETKKSARIGILNTASRQDRFVQSMLARLAELGWSTGLFGSGNLSIEYRTVEPGGTDIAPAVDAVVRAKCDLIVATNTPLALAVKAAAPSTPLVVVTGAYPVALGLVASMANPGGWTIASHESGTRLIDLLRDIAPRAKRLAQIFQGGNVATDQIHAAWASHASAAGMSLRPFPVHGRNDIHALDPVWTREPVDRLVVDFGPVTVANAGEVVRLAALHRVPAAYGSRFFTDAGGLLSYGVNWSIEVKRTADFVARILDGAKPGDIPVERCTQFELLVNQRTARALGISVPQTVLAQATEVIQ
jgi:putative tryptophan/tyrosine transport system substrate-binding protein